MEEAAGYKDKHQNTCTQDTWRSAVVGRAFILLSIPSESFPVGLCCLEIVLSDTAKIHFLDILRASEMPPKKIRLKEIAESDSVK